MVNSFLWLEMMNMNVNKLTHIPEKWKKVSKESVQRKGKKPTERCNTSSKNITHTFVGLIAR